MKNDDKKKSTSCKNPFYSIPFEVYNRDSLMDAVIPVNELL